MQARIASSAAEPRRWFGLLDRPTRAALVITAGSVLWFAVTPLDRHTQLFRVVVAVFAGLIAAGQWRISRDRRLSRSSVRFWRIMAVGMWIYTAGMVLDLVAGLVGGLPGIPLTNPGTVLLYPVAWLCTLVSLVVFPNASSSRAERVRIALDSAAVMIGMAMLVWYFVVGTQWRPGDGWLALSERLILPALAVVAGFAILRIAMAGANVISKPAIGCFVFSASCAAVPTILGIHPGTPGGRYCSMIHVVGLAAAVVGVSVQRSVGPGAPGAVRTGWRRPFTVLPYGAIAATGAILLMIISDQLDWRDWFVVGCAAAMAIVVMGRQFVAFRENSKLLLANQELTTRLRHQAFHDDLTGLANRALLTEQIGQALARSRLDGAEVAVLFVDLDDFKIVNDSLGHETGDELLVAVSARLRGSVRAGGTLGRLGGDEFAILIEGESRESITLMAERIVAVLGEPFRLSGKQVHVKASIGIATATAGVPDTAELLRNADVAMYAAKTGHKGRWRFFEPEMLVALLRRHQMHAALVDAVEHGYFSVHYQPIIDLLTGTVTGAEALVRWRRPDGRQVPPDEFIPLAEDTGLIAEIDRLVLRQACNQAARWRGELASGAPFAIHVNLSARELHRPDLVGDVERVLCDSGLPPECLTLEITESGLGKDQEAAIERLGGLSRLGVHLAIDDFGTGYSSLAYLQRMPVDVLKIDKSFTGELAGESGEAPLAQAVIALAATLGMHTVAEGIEERVQADRLLALGCRHGQGFHYARSMPAEEFERLLAGGGQYHAMDAIVAAAGSG